MSICSRLEDPSPYLAKSHDHVLEFAELEQCLQYINFQWEEVSIPGSRYEETKYNNIYCKYMCCCLQMCLYSLVFVLGVLFNLKNRL